MTDGRYRITRAGYDVVSAFGCLDAVELPGTAIITVLGRRGYTESAVRNQIARLVYQGVLVTRRSGRHAVYAVADRLGADFERIAGRDEPAPFTGSFSQVVHEVPESQRAFKDRLHYLLPMHGYGRLRSGVAIAPVDRSGELRHLIGTPPRGAWIGYGTWVVGDLEEARRLVDRAFDLSTCHQELTHLERQLREREERARGGDAGGTQAHFDVHHRAAMTSFKIPQLPAELVTHDAVARRQRLMRQLSVYCRTWLQADDMAAVSELDAAHLVRPREDIPAD